MAEFVRYKLENGAEVVFEAAEGDLVQLHGGGEPDVVDGGRLQTRLAGVAAAAEQVAGSLRSRLAPEEIALEFGLKVSGEVNWWFFAKNQAEGTIKVTLKWNARPQPAPDSESDPEDEAEDGVTEPSREDKSG
ncbi:MAG: CU044_2847 family protein [Pseudonocardiaceae bacterium]